MAKISRPRFGSLQFWPRKRAEKFIPSVNWSVVKSDSEGLMGFISYKVGMTSALVKDETPDSMTKGKKITMPVTILEVPNMKVYSIRFYKNGKVMKDVAVSNDKSLKKKLKTAKENRTDLDKIEGWDDIRVIIYPAMKDMFKKTPDLAEVAIKAGDKLAFAKSIIGKEISVLDNFAWKSVDVRGLTKGKGLQGPVKRFGISLKGHKSEKGRRNPGSLGPWHPSRVTFRTPVSGQLGMFTRVHYNLKVIDSGKISENDINPASGFKNYGKIKTNYIVVAGSVQGPQKRQILVTSPMRPNKKSKKRKYEFMEILR